MKEPPKRKKDRAPVAPRAPQGKMLTMKLRELAMDIVTSDLVDGEVVMMTRAELLAQEIWNAACGIKRNKDGEQTLTHLPIPWAVATVLERLEGKVIPRAKDSSNRPGLSKRIDEQQKLKIEGLKKHD